MDTFRLIFAYTDSMAQDERHRVYMSFMDRQGWQVQFLEADLKTPCPGSCTSSPRRSSSNLWRAAAGWGT